jgi:hypothetical protein
MIKTLNKTNEKLPEKTFIDYNQIGIKSANHSFK